MTKRTWSFITLFYMAAILASSLVPGGAEEGGGVGRRAFVMNMLHIPVYALLTFLWIKTCAASRLVSESASPIVGESARKLDSKSTSQVDSKSARKLLSEVASPIVGESVRKLGNKSTSQLAHQPASPLAIFTLVVLFGILNEFVQATTPGREFSVADMLRNALGAGLVITTFGVRPQYQTPISIWY
jgi:hypothetical protein